MPQETYVGLPDISDQVVDGKITIDFLLPNGLFFPLKVDFYSPLDLLKQRVWEEAESFPLFNNLKQFDSYFFIFLNKDGEKEEVTDESLRLSEIRPIGKFLKVGERRSEGNHKTVDRQITNLIGSRSLMEMQSLPRAEVDDFRKRMLHYAESVAPDRQNPFALFATRHPQRLRHSASIPDEISQTLNNGYMVLSVMIQETQASFKMRAHINDSPEMVVDAALRKWHNHSVRNYDYILKAVGIDDFLYGKEPLLRFKFVYNCLLRNKAPEFWLINRNTVYVQEPEPVRRVAYPRGTIVGKKNGNDIPVWDVWENFSLKISGIHNIEMTSENIEKVKLFIAIYHGIEVLGDVMTTKELPVSSGNCSVNAVLSTDLAVADIQHTSRLCFCLHGRTKGGKGFEPISWVNVPVFDFRSRLTVGERKFRMWPMMPDLHLEETGCYPLGTVSLNPHNSITLTVHFSDYSRSQTIICPSEEKITQCAADNMERLGQPGHPQWKATPEQIAELNRILDSVTEDLCDQDKTLIWQMRYYCRDDNPQALPKVLNSVKWQNHIDVAKMQILLNTWQTISVDQALELLDFNFPDKNVRQYAVSCLQDLSDDELSLYLLQLVQALKYETYLYCPLAEFLLKRAIHNQHIGQQLFWLLKSELHNPTVAIRFSLMLEAYLKVNTEHMHVLHRQYEALNKLYTVSQLVKPGKTKDDKIMHAVLNQKTYQEKLSVLVSPLNPLYRLNDLQIKNCKVMDSKKRPLYLVWSNTDPEGPEVHIIYKNGDDLRQDMLTLQMLQVMDSIWQEVGLDLRMNIYGCIASGFEQGMIEVVRYSTTIAKIQTDYNSTLDKKTLYEWLKLKNPTEKGLEQAVEEFILSCAGYTVATYILGIGDRHNDNIMLKENGQLFHIDFGHFLGNFKSKYGIKRERVAFVLTYHFVYVITNGDKNVKNWERFQQYCVDAYLALRKRGPLLIRLFMMMLSSGIPQLTTISDLDYLKDTLALKMSEEAAAKSLRKKMSDAVNSKSTVINWVAHNFAH